MIWTSIGDITMNEVEFSNVLTTRNGASYSEIRCNVTPHRCTVEISNCVDYVTDREQNLKFEFTNVDQLEKWLNSVISSIQMQRS